jgi:hypothetical protein
MIPLSNNKNSDPNRALFLPYYFDGLSKKGNTQQQKKWLILSTISDLQLSKKENISCVTWLLSLYEVGDIDRKLISTFSAL